jgi:hypothetical protein
MSEKMARQPNLKGGYRFLDREGYVAHLREQLVVKPPGQSLTGEEVQRLGKTEPVLSRVVGLPAEKVRILLEEIGAVKVMYGDTGYWFLEGDGVRASVLRAQGRPRAMIVLPGSPHRLEDIIEEAEVTVNAREEFARRCLHDALSEGTYRVLKQLLANPSRWTDLLDSRDSRSLGYHIQRLVEANLVSGANGLYYLTPRGVAIMNFLTEIDHTEEVVRGTMRHKIEESIGSLEDYLKVVGESQ